MLRWALEDTKLCHMSWCKLFNDIKLGYLATCNCVVEVRSKNFKRNVNYSRIFPLLRPRRSNQILDDLLAEYFKDVKHGILASQIGQIVICRLRFIIKGVHWVAKNRLIFCCRFGKTWSEQNESWIGEYIVFEKYRKAEQSRFKFRSWRSSRLILSNLIGEFGQI